MKKVIPENPQGGGGLGPPTLVGIGLGNNP